MARARGSLSKSSKGEAEVVGWENRRGRVFVVKDSDDQKVARTPTDRTIESARRVVIKYGDRYYTAYGVNPDFTLDDIIREIESDFYKEIAS